MRHRLRLKQPAHDKVGRFLNVALSIPTNVRHVSPT